MTESFHIASLIVQARPERLAAVAAAIEALPGDVAGSDPAGKLVVVLEAPTERTVVDRIDAIQKLEGVLNALLVYQHAEPARSLQEVIQ